MEEKRNKIKSRVILALETFGKLPSSRLATIIGINYNTLKPILIEMKKNKTIKSKKFDKLATYWRLNDETK